MNVSLADLPVKSASDPSRPGWAGHDHSIARFPMPARGPVPRERAPYLHLIPKTFEANVDWRKRVYRRAFEDGKYAAVLRQMCARDLLFWVNGFVMTYDPRPAIGEYRDDKAGFTYRFRQSFSDEFEVPFITFEAQDWAFLDTQESIGRCDIGAEKSRDMGMTWIMLMTLLHEAQFKRMRSFLVSSRTGDEVDMAGFDNPDTLFWKIDYAIRKQPSFMRPKVDRSKFRIAFPETESTINGATSTGNLGRGGRRTGWFGDEFAAFRIADGYEALGSTQSTTPCRMFCSTPQGLGNAYADQMHTGIRKITLHWSAHPMKSKGMYRSHNGVLEILDEGYEFPDNYPFKLDGELRSPFYDVEDLRTPLKAILHQEQDIDYLGSGAQFFNIQALRAHIVEYARDPYRTGELVVDEDPRISTWRDVKGGRFQVWCPLQPRTDERAREIWVPQRDRRYGIGVDISAGTGASNSSISVGDLKTRRKVATMATPSMAPEAWAHFCAAVGYWFCGPDGTPAIIIWESNGPGRQFGNRLIEIGYRSLFYRQKEEQIGSPTTSIPGWHAGKDSVRVLLGDYNQALVDAAIINPDEISLRECEMYIFSGDGGVKHSKATNPLDPSGAGANHGDRCRSDALLWRVMSENYDNPRNPETSDPDRMDPGCMAYRRARRKRELSMEDLW